MIKLKLLGGAAIESEDGPLAQRALQRRRVALLALLAVARKPLSREKVTALLWPEADSEQARHLLSVAVYELRKAIHDEAIVTSRDDVAVNPAYIGSDVADFEGALASGDRSGAADIYRGPFMDGFHINDAPEYERWIDGERDRLARTYAGALEQLAQQYTEAGRTTEAVAVLRKLAAHDPYSGRVASMLMLALEASGDRAAALQHERAHAALLKEEFGADPDPDVAALAQRLRREPGDAVAAPAATPRRRAPSPRAYAAHGSKRSVIFAAAITAVITVVALAAIVFWRTRSVTQAQADTRAVRTIAVLPFRNLTTSEENTVFAEGLSEQINNALSSVTSLDVVSQTSTSKFRGADVREVGKELNVDHVLEGSVLMGNDRVKVTATLTNAATRFKVWHDSYDKPLAMADLLYIQEEIARSVVAALQAKLTEPQARTLVQQQTDDLGAFQLYITGSRYLNRRNVRDMMAALQFFERAIARDSGYALAYAGKAEALALLGAYDYGGLPPADAFPPARAAAQRALELDPAVAQAHAALGSIRFNYDRDWAGAEKAFLRAIELNHGYSMAYHWYALLLHVQQRRQDALRNIMRARELDPASSVAATGLARNHYFARDYPGAVREYRNALQADSTFVTAHVGLGITYAVSGQPAQAIQQFQTAAKLLGRTPPLLHALQAYAYGSGGQPEEAEKNRQTLLAMAKRVYVPPEIVAMAHIGVRDYDATFRALDDATARRAGGVNYLKIDPLVDPIRADPRFDALINRVFGKTR
jgi:DNA-binding SARP family transcriptional activator/TolB-like protein